MIRQHYFKFVPEHPISYLASATLVEQNGPVVTLEFHGELREGKSNGRTKLVAVNHYTVTLDCIPTELRILNFALETGVIHFTLETRELTKGESS